MKRRKLLTIGSVGLAAFAVIIAVCNTPKMGKAAQEASSDVPPIDFMEAALNDQAQASIEVRYEHEYTSKTDSQHYVTQMHYIRTPEVQRLDQVWPSGKTTRMSYDTASTEFRLLDVAVGRASTSTGGKQDAITAKDFLETALYFVYDKDLPKAIRTGTVSPQKEEVEGHQCWRIDIPLPFYLKADQVSVWLDPSISFCPRRVEIPEKGETEPLVVSFRNYREIDTGVWFPMEQVRTSSRSTLVNRVKEALCLNPKPSKEEIVVQFPAGTVVDVRGKNMTYTVP